MFGRRAPQCNNSWNVEECPTRRPKPAFWARHERRDGDLQTFCVPGEPNRASFGDILSRIRQRILHLLCLRRHSQAAGCSSHQCFDRRRLSRALKPWRISLNSRLKVKSSLLSVALLGGRHTRSQNLKLHFNSSPECSGNIHLHRLRWGGSIGVDVRPHGGGRICAETASTHDSRNDFVVRTKAPSSNARSNS